MKMLVLLKLRLCNGSGGKIGCDVSFLMVDVDEGHGDDN